MIIAGIRDLAVNMDVIVVRAIDDVIIMFDTTPIPAANSYLCVLIVSVFLINLVYPHVPVDKSKPLSSNIAPVS